MSSSTTGYIMGSYVQTLINLIDGDNDKHIMYEWWIGVIEYMWVKKQLDRIQDEQRVKGR